METFYSTDAQFLHPVIDLREERLEPVRHTYIHGAFEGTELRFSFFFPPQSDYTGRFFHYVAPMQGHEDSSLERKGEEDRIAFALTHGAYFVETNMGVGAVFGLLPDVTILFRAGAVAAEFSRVVARDLYGPHRPYGYVYGGSGGGFKSTACVQNSTVWDGAVPHVIGSPMAIPNCFTVRAHARRVLRDHWESIADALEAGGTGNPYAGLNDEQASALREATALGFPPRSWFLHAEIDDGALPVLTWAVVEMDPAYYTDFWTKPGYLGTDPKSSVLHDRLLHPTQVTAVHLPEASAQAPVPGTNNVDDAWQNLRTDRHLASRPWVSLASLPSAIPYWPGTVLVVTSGAAAGAKFPLERLEGDKAVIGAGFGVEHLLTALAQLKPEDEVCLDNSDYLAIQTYHRHQVPDSSYAGWETFCQPSGMPLYPQRPFLLGPHMARNGAGSAQSGVFHGKMIVLACLMDESAFPWQADWYRQRVREVLGSQESDRFRLWFMDHALHGDSQKVPDVLRVVSYAGALQQALLDLSDWVERGIIPASTSRYEVKTGQVEVPVDETRLGIQPVVTLAANGGSRAVVKVGEPVLLTGTVAVPERRAQITSVGWSLDGEPKFTPAVFTRLEGGTKARVELLHTFGRPGTHFVVLHAAAHRHGDRDRYTQIQNLARVRVVVE